MKLFTNAVVTVDTYFSIDWVNENFLMKASVQLYDVSQMIHVHYIVHIDHTYKYTMGQNYLFPM